MDDDDVSEAAAAGAADRLAMVRMYMETLQLRMEPGQFEALSAALHSFLHVMGEGGEGSYELDEEAFTDEMHREFLTLMGIVTTGTLDLRVVEMPAADGSKGWALVTADAAEDAAKLEELGRKLHDVEQRVAQAVAETEAMIEEASEERSGEDPGA